MEYLCKRMQYAVAGGFVVIDVAIRCLCGVVETRDLDQQTIQSDRSLGIFMLLCPSF